MSSRVMYGYRRNREHGHIEHRQFDPDHFPEGWYDSPSKVPGESPPLAPLAISPEPRRSGPLHGDEEPRKRRRK
jgi:hypothetical protein